MIFIYKQWYHRVGIKETYIELGQKKKSCILFLNCDKVDILRGFSLLPTKNKMDINIVSLAIIVLSLDHWYYLTILHCFDKNLFLLSDTVYIFCLCHLCQSVLRTRVILCTRVCHAWTVMYSITLVAAWSMNEKKIIKYNDR